LAETGKKGELMAAGTKNIVIEQGSTFSMKMTFTDSVNAPIDVSSWTFKGQIKESASSTTTTADFSFANSSNTNDKVVTLSPLITAGIPAAASTGATKKNKIYAYDIEATKGDGTVVRILQGTATLSPEVTTS
jgi:hypothetical protein